MIQTQFFEKKYRSLFDGTAPEFQGQKYPYILFFQVNHVTSKEWISLKNLFHERSPSTIHHMIPKRFLVQILQPDVFPQKTHSLFSFLEDHNQISFKDSISSSKGPLQGHSCFFFCQTFDEVQKFFQNSHDIFSESHQGPFGLSFEEPLVLSKTFWTPSQEKRFRPLGLLERLQTQKFSLVFWNPYDVQKILYLTSQKISPYQNFLTQVLYPTITQPLQMLQTFCSLNLSGGPFLYHHYELYTLLIMLSLKKQNTLNPQIESKNSCESLKEILNGIHRLNS